MVYSLLGKRAVSTVLAMSFMVSGCMPSDVASTRQRINTVVPGGDSTAGVGSGATGGSALGATSINPTVEIRHLIEPNLSNDPTYSSGTGYGGGGSYVRKLTLPKNFAGKIYVAGINIGTLANRHVKVRFKFGMGLDPVTIPGIVATAPGITPQTNISVLVMDLRAEPFRNIRLPYDLYDYNSYESGALGSPTQDNRNSGLYCRGLKVTHDSTFKGVGACDGIPAGTPTQPDEQCLYSYAKVLDQGLVKKVTTTLIPATTTFVPTMPTLPQARSTAGSSYYQDFMAKHLMKPLLDNAAGPFKFSEVAVPVNFTDSKNLDFKQPVSPFAMIWTEQTNLPGYFYRGPYRLINTGEWEYKFSDPTAANGLFKQKMTYTGPALNPAIDQFIYYQSLIFPLATKLDLPPNVPHLSSANWDGVRAETTLSAAGKTLWMDGSNARAQSKNGDLEHIGSCNVSATIEIIAKDDNLNEYIIANSNEVKLQLVRPTQYYTDSGTDVLYSNFKTCSSNASCGGNECCFNNRCWDESLVSQCYDASAVNGNRPIGDSCLTDMECTSLCCNRTSGLCAPHNTILSPPVLCSKPIGDFCISKDWCQKIPVVKCLVVKTGTTPTGTVTCRQQCYTVEVNGDCNAGTCVAPFQEPVPVFNPAAAGACDAAVPAPRF